MGFKAKSCVRYNEPYHAHALTFSCFRKLPLLASQVICGILIESLERARQRQKFDLWAYVVMPDHVHLMVWPRRKVYSISSILFSVKRPASYRAGKAGLRPEAHLWQRGGGYDRNLWTPAAVHKEIDYIHANPVRRGLCEAPEQWKFSSAAFWAGQKDVPIEMDNSLPPRTQARPD